MKYKYRIIYSIHAQKVWSIISTAELIFPGFKVFLLRMHLDFTRDLRIKLITWKILKFQPLCERELPVNTYNMREWLTLASKPYSGNHAASIPLQLYHPKFTNTHSRLVTPGFSSQEMQEIFSWKKSNLFLKSSPF